MDVYLLPRRNREYFLYSPAVVEAPSVEPADGESGARKLVGQARSAYRWVARRRLVRERLLKSLGEIDRLRIFHPSSLPEDEARAAYDRLIRGEIERHGKWLIVDAAGVPVSVPLSLIPGPNLILGYLAWRSLAHYLAKKAGRRAAELPIDFVPVTALSELEDVVRNQTRFRRKRKIRRLGEELGIANLDEAY